MARCPLRADPSEVWTVVSWRGRWLRDQTTEKPLATTTSRLFTQDLDPLAASLGSANRFIKPERIRNAVAEVPPLLIVVRESFALHRRFQGLPVGRDEAGRVRGVRGGAERV